MNKNNEFEKNFVFNLQEEAKSEFEKQIQEEFNKSDTKEIDECLHNVISNIKNLVIKKFDQLENYIQSKKPKKPKKEPKESEAEFDTKCKVYKNELEMFKILIFWSISLMEQLNTWFSELWSWIKNEIHNISTK
ncbi:hypothetical protein Glove_14g27 [Diversispora epigaea]|uniref:Uncharacterized protein n=1 Tax=Diversispora epigaea TaxID=1348612 RepID=A0A397JRG8_9GLOM|nr:hypothetical protein Glove_14g27 [Diversispora epigaea]